VEAAPFGASFSFQQAEKRRLGDLLTGAEDVAGLAADACSGGARQARAATSPERQG